MTFELPYGDWAPEARMDQSLPLGMMRSMGEHWCDATSDPRGLRYIEVDVDETRGFLRALLAEGQFSAEG